MISVRAHLHEVGQLLPDARGEVKFSVGPVGLSSVQGSQTQDGLGPITVGPNCESNPDPFNLSPIIKKIMGSPSHISGNQRRRARLGFHGRRGVASS